MKFKKSLFVGAILLATQTVNAYDVVERFKLVDDKLKTDAMLRPFGHDFFIDINASLNKDLPNTVKDISDASKTTDAATALINAQNLLLKYSGTEQTVKVNVAVGIPLFSFSIGEAKIQPNIRAFVDAGATIGFRDQPLTLDDLFALFPVSIPAELKTYIGTLHPGDDVIALCRADSSLSATTRAFCGLQPTGKYKIPSATDPSFAFFAKLDGKVGLFNDYEYGEHFFGNLNVYGLSRTDIYQTATASSVASGTKIELPSTKNTETTAQLDYRLGYKNVNYRVNASVEELKLMTVKSRVAASREISYGYNALMRLHGEVDYRYSVLLLQPFAGVHSRSGYGFGDGVYVGATAAAHVWGDRLGVSLRGMLDKDYITVTPRFKLWLMQLEYSLKTPIKSTEGDVKLSAINSIDFRLFF